MPQIPFCEEYLKLTVNQVNIHRKHVNQETTLECSKRMRRITIRIQSNLSHVRKCRSCAGIKVELLIWKDFVSSTYTKNVVYCQLVFCLYSFKICLEFGNTYTIAQSNQTNHHDNLKQDNVFYLLKLIIFRSSTFGDSSE